MQQLGLPLLEEASDNLDTKPGKKVLVVASVSGTVYFLICGFLSVSGHNSNCPIHVSKGVAHGKKHFHLTNTTAIKSMHLSNELFSQVKLYNFPLYKLISGGLQAPPPTYLNCP